MSGVKNKYPLIEDIQVTSDIILGSLFVEDFPTLIANISDKEIYNNTLMVPYPYKTEDAQFYFNLIKSFEKESGIKKDWTIRHKGNVIGGIGLLYNYGLKSHKSEMGYWIGKSFRNKGIMTKVIRQFADYIFNNRKLIRLEANVFIDNSASVKVLEKAGFNLEGQMKYSYMKDGALKDSFLYSKISPTIS